jgi:tRNA G46 methylase TrmB
VNAEVVSILCGVVTALHLDFGDHVRTGPSRRRADQAVHDRHAVETKAVLNLTLAGADEVFAGRDAGIAAGRADDDVGSGGGNFQGVMAHQRKVADCLGVECFTQGRIVCGDRRRGCRNGNGRRC